MRRASCRPSPIGTRTPSLRAPTPSRRGRAIRKRSSRRSRKSVPTLDVGITSLRAQRPFLRDFAAFSGSLERVATRLPRNLPRITPALETGARVQRRAVTLNRDLGRTFAALERLGNDPGTGIALRGLTRTTGILNPFLRFLGPYITVCNYFNYSWTNAGEHLTEPDPTGTAQRTLLNQVPRNQNPSVAEPRVAGRRSPGQRRAGHLRRPGQPAQQPVLGGDQP